MIELGDVVAATDSSERGAKAVVTGAACARRADAELAILSVVEALLPPLRPETAQWLDEHTEETRREVEEQARQARAEHAPVHIAQGLAAPVIAEKVQELGADLLVVGAHPQPAVSRFLLGSTTERLVRLVSCPLLVTTEERTDPFERVLVAVDLSPQSRDVLEQALAIATAAT
nr:universal stress protein [Gammaproteobacteria bacterium]